MALLTVDKEKCRQDGICKNECPRNIIRLNPPDGFPSIAPEHESICLSCGHCVVICPHSALSLATVPLERCPEIRDDLAIGKEEAVQFLRSRRSVRLYRNREVEPATVTELLHLARYAPSATNAQPLEWTVVLGKDKVRELSAHAADWMKNVISAAPDSLYAGYFRPIVKGWDGGYDGILRGAPALVVASAPSTAMNGLVDCTIALTYLELFALPLNLGTCWAGLLQAALLNHPPAAKALGLPEGHTWHYPMMLGYPKFSYARLPERKPPVIHWK